MAKHAGNPKILWVGSRAVPLAIRVHARARHIGLAVDGRRGGVRLTLPTGTSVSTGLRFAARHEDWLAARLDKLPPRMPFADGASVPVLGRDHQIRHAPDARRGVWREDSCLFVSGRPEHLARRLTDYLKDEALREAGARATAVAARIDRRPTRISVREMKSRWGSCSADGSIRFAWRLILAPEDVFDYVVAHEVAHLVHMNHGPRFWKLVERLCPEAGEARRWLRGNGERLLRYG